MKEFIFKFFSTFNGKLTIINVGCLVISTLALIATENRGAWTFSICVNLLALLFNVLTAYHLMKEIKND